ncbi:MAG: septum formation initiator family protein [Lachnospiraceae bacterium]|jgi:cell division protein DivIC|nr:septum formation initiator family protein [Lachnospiraceae bacterium]MBR5355357.1 septum formation initiator family protein [Lachnospiraceae bacterium]
MAHRYTRRKKRKNQNFRNMTMITFVVAMILVVVFIKNGELKEKKAGYEKREQYLLEQIEEQNKRSEEIEEYRKYTKTKQYVEDMAKEKLGLVYKDEVIFEAEN